jgi:multisubunit Na+/H+ antiporter MnhB subunit
MQCEVAGGAAWGEPASTVTSLVFVVVGVWLWFTRRRRPDGGAQIGVQGSVAVLAVLIGTGSVVQHGPAPSWNPVVHDPPLLALLALVAADGVADLAQRRLRAWWWLVPGVVCAALALWRPGWSAAAQGAVAAVAVGITLVRARRRPALRRHLLPGLALLGLGGAIGTMSRPGWPWCVPESWLQGHAVWHVLAALAIAVLAPALGSRGSKEP